MAKRKNKHGNGANDAPYIARGRGGGGSGGRGGFVRGRGRGGHPTSPGSSFMPEELDFTIHMYADCTYSGHGIDCALNFCVGCSTESSSSTGVDEWVFDAPWWRARLGSGTGAGTRLEG
ncbi:hypothetical protein P691DRAFT_801670 [Macrolepiota fuliginosa MF-IS2]|uniref:Uncharacterized protein n=1 Tax=Macrolepiota fuliginosa MF-IS2 TaxID=1400762 RepID=A0A9P6C3Y1_9AGAR|nr:hypothetical protein P691DRAFT_801670 [Macrolepiota fuliginosa MF-IS2]